MTNKKILIIISVLCIVGGIIGLIVYLTTRKKDDGKTPSPHGPSPNGPSPNGPDPGPTSPGPPGPDPGPTPPGPPGSDPGPTPPGPDPGPTPPGPSPSKKQSVTFQIENLPPFSYPCPSPNPNSGQPCIHPEGFMIGWSDGNKAIGIPKYGKSITVNHSFKISDGKLIIGAINFIASKHCTLPNNTPCFSIWFYGSATNHNLQSICQNSGDCSINIKIKDKTYILNMNDISGQSIVSDEQGVWGATFYWRNPENVGAEGKEGMWTMPKAGDNVTISITQS